MKLAPLIHMDCIMEDLPVADNCVVRRKVVERRDFICTTLPAA